MKLIVISPPKEFLDEPRVVGSILKQSSAVFHLRKPGYSHEKLVAYLKRIPGGLHGRIMVHGHPDLIDQFALKGVHFAESRRRQDWRTIQSLRQQRPDCSISSSFHRIDDITQDAFAFDYIFLSPIFDSISKQDYLAAFDTGALKRFLSGTGHKVVALGGVDGRRIATAAAMGFWGVAVLGAVWSGGCPEKTVRQLSAACRQGFRPCG
ncbi:thiamine phosphate synthase [Desulfosarcina widdelii]|uniref:Thiamine phosphate synthase n=1 Tax=Desulfosarcina widdelii TaxID=947919 RepID=A0A5K7Z321_9BACT|nr:thiamine phosphate synthase [Desulfosarcina widdelii]BBO75105.1 thiamine phosphate synthase [Desulfosarcina widdelii]